MLVSVVLKTYLSNLLPTNPFTEPVPYLIREGGTNRVTMTPKNVAYTSSKFTTSGGQNAVRQHRHITGYATRLSEIGDSTLAKSGGLKPHPSFFAKIDAPPSRISQTQTRAGRELMPLFVLLFGLLVCAANVDSASAQIRPTIIDPGEVNETRHRVQFDRSRIGSTKASRTTYGVLIVLSDPKDAEVKIDGKSAGKTVDGYFKRELPAGRLYSVQVAAGPDHPDYISYKKEVRLKAREPEIVEAAMTSKFGVITIFPAMDGVTLSLDGKPIPAAQVQIDKASQLITINNVPPGDHTATYDLPGYLLYERKFQVTPGAIEKWQFIPEKAVDEVVIATDPGTTVYLDGQPVGNTPENGTLNLPDVSTGNHEIKLAKDGYEEFARTVLLEYKKPVTVDQKLTPIPTSAEFSDTFEFANASKWTMPASGWKIESGHLAIENSPGVGYASKILYRGFESSFDLKLGNTGGAAWVVRMKDPGNYYLFYLSGPSGLYPNSFVTYIVKDKNFDPQKPFNISPIVVQLTAGAQYHIEIQADKNLINTYVDPVATGRHVALGSFTDPDNTFPYGGIGFRTVASEKFSITDLYVQPK